MGNKRGKTTVTEFRWQRYVGASAAGAMALLGSESPVDADFTYLSVNTPLSDRNPGDGYFDSFGPYTFGGSGALFYFRHANEFGNDAGLLGLIGRGNISFAGVFGSPNFTFPMLLTARICHR